MDATGGVPEPLLPPQIALQNPELVGGYLFHVVPALGQIVVMLDTDGDENYVPHVIPLDGGFPEPLAEEAFAGGRSHLVHLEETSATAYFAVESREESLTTAISVDLATGATRTIWQSGYGGFVAAETPDRSGVVLADGYTMGDIVLYEVDDVRGAANALRNADRGARGRGRVPALRLRLRLRNARAVPACCSRRTLARRRGIARVSRSGSPRRGRSRSRSRCRARRRRRARRDRTPRR